MTKPDYNKINDEILQDEFNKREEGDNLEVWEDDFNWDEPFNEDAWIVPDGEAQFETGEFDHDGNWIYY